MNRFRRSAVLVAVAIATSMAAHAQQVISFPANDIIYNPSDGMIYASVPGAEGAEGNSIIPLDPNTGLFGTAVFVGSEPDQLAISDDGQFLYVALDGANSVRRFNLATQTPEITFGLGNSSTCGGALHAEDIQVMPGAAHTVAVSKANNGCSPANEGVTIYDDGVARANSVGGFGSPGGLLPDVIAFSADAKTLYAQDTEVSSKDFIQMAVSASGLSLTTSGVGSPLALDIHFDNGLIYGDNGVAFDPTTVTQAGVYFDKRVFIGFEVARPDSQNNLMFLLAPTGSSSTIQLYTFKENQFTEIVEQDLNNVQGNIVANRALPVRRMIRWGANGLAFTTGTQIWLLQLPFITATTSTTTSVISSESPAPFGQPYTLTATVNAGGSVATAATGTMTFTVGNTTPVAVAVNNGVAIYSPPTLDFGNYSVQAQYSGDAVYMPSLGSFTQRVVTVASTTTLSASPNPVFFGNTATLVATVTGPNGPVNQGEVLFTSSTNGQLC